MAHTGEGAGATASRPVVTGEELPKLHKTRLSSVKPAASHELSPLFKVSLVTASDAQPEDVLGWESLRPFGLNSSSLTLFENTLMSLHRLNLAVEVSL